MNHSGKETLILGVGNEILTDDGIGPCIVNKISEMGLFAGADFLTANTGGLEVIEIIQGYKSLIIIDAIKTIGGIPGTVYRFCPDDFKETHHLSSFHDVSFLTGLKLGKQIGLKVPENISIIAIEIVEDLTFNVNFSPIIEKKYDEIFNEALSMLIDIYNKDKQIQN
jgi:hydrogenase maturation protease